MEIQAAIEERHRELEARGGVDWTPIDHTKAQAMIETDIDARCRIVQHEMDRAIHNSNEFMDSEVLHGAGQRFPTKVLRLELERELDRLLREQARRRP